MAQQMMEEAQAQAAAMQQKMAAAMGGDEIQELQRKMTEADDAATWPNTCVWRAAAENDGRFFNNSKTMHHGTEHLA